MKTGKIIECLAETYPLKMAEKWDNPGLQVGRTDRPVKKVMVALDATDDVIAQCIEWGAELLVTHHPLMMSGISKINCDTLSGRRVLALAEHGISHYAIHTNYDVTKMAELAEAALKLKKTEILEVTGTDEQGNAYGIGKIGELQKKMTAADCCEMVKKSFGLKSVRLFGCTDTVVKRIAVSPGSGKSMIAPAAASGVQLLITGDIGHHEGLDAVDQGLCVIDAGHYGIEHIFIHDMAGFLKEKFPDVKVKEAKTQEPFLVF